MANFPKLSQYQYDWCLSILDKIEKMHISQFFKTKTVSDETHNKNYYSIISTPMDLATCRENLVNEQYDSVLKFGSDVRLIFDNAMQYYPPGDPIFMMAQELHNWFEKKFQSFPRSSNEKWLMKLRKIQGKVDKLIMNAPPMIPNNISQKEKKPSS